MGALQSYIESRSGSHFYYDRALNNYACTIDLLDGTNKLFRGIITSIPSIGITNSWNADGSNVIDTLIDTIVGFIQNPMMSDAVNGVSDLINSLSEMVGMQDKVQPITDGVKKYGMNSRISGVSKLVKRYDGTTVDLNLPDLSIIVLNDDGNVNLKAMVNDLIDKSAGHYVDLGDASDFIGIQTAPNDYQVDYRAGLRKGAKLRGTYDLRIGNYFLLHNVVISSFKYEYSTATILSHGKPTKNPAYVKLTLDVEFAKTPSPDELKEYNI